MEDTDTDAIAQYDSAKINTGGHTMAWFAENNRKVMEWPLKSPDVTTIEQS